MHQKKLPSQKHLDVIRLYILTYRNFCVSNPYLYKCVKRHWTIVNYRNRLEFALATEISF